MNLLTEKEKAARLRKKHKLNALYTVLVIGACTVLFGIAGRIDYKVNAAEEATSGKESNFVLKDAVSYDWGNTIVTSDGNEWAVQDPPEFEEGQRIKILFDTKGTADLEDDEIVDLWEVE